MTRSYTEAEVLALVAELTDGHLRAWTAQRIVQPMLSEAGPRYRELDIARLRTMVELEDGFALGPDALGMVMGLMDQLHGMQADLLALMAALAAEPAELRARLAAAIAARD